MAVECLLGPPSKLNMKFVFRDGTISKGQGNMEINDTDLFCFNHHQGDIKNTQTLDEWKGMRRTWTTCGCALSSSSGDQMSNELDLLGD